MVRNSDIETEFHLFSEVWKVYKRLLPVKPRHNEQLFRTVGKGFGPCSIKRFGKAVHGK